MLSLCSILPLSLWSLTNCVLRSSSRVDESLNRSTRSVVTSGGLRLWPSNKFGRRVAAQVIYFWSEMCNFIAIARQRTPESYRWTSPIPTMLPAYRQGAIQHKLNWNTHFEGSRHGPQGPSSSTLLHRGAVLAPRPVDYPHALRLDTKSGLSVEAHFN